MYLGLNLFNSIEDRPQFSLSLSHVVRFQVSTAKQEKMQQQTSEKESGMNLDSKYVSIKTIHGGISVVKCVAP
jgi:hypothetical protein